MSKPRRILLLVAYPARDLEGLALVGHCLERVYGHEVIYTNGYSIERKLLKHRPDVFGIDHFVWKFKVDQSRMAARMGMKVIMLPTEGLTQNPEAFLEITGGQHNALGEFHSYLCWGQYPKRALIDHGHMDPKKIEVVGCPRFDYYHPRFRSIAEPRDAFLQRFQVQNPQNPLLVWTTNTTYLSRDREETIRRYTQKGNYTRDQVLEFIEDEQEQFKYHSATILELAKQRPNWNILIKTHPAEWIDPYQSLIQQAPNLYLAYNWPIRDFLIHCDVLLQRNCTTATEAWMLDKPVIQMEQGTYRRQARPEYLSGNHITRSPQETLEVVDSYLRGEPISSGQVQARQEFIADFYHQVDGQSYRRWADAIHRLAAGPEHTDEDHERKNVLAAQAFEDWKAQEDRRLPNRLKDLFGIDRDRPLRFWRDWRFGKERSTLGKFNPEKDTAREDVEPLYRKLDQLGDFLKS